MFRDYYCGAGLTTGLNDLEGILQPWWFCDSVTLRTMLRLLSPVLFGHVYLCYASTWPGCQQCIFQCWKMLEPSHTSPLSQASVMCPSKSALKSPLQSWQACWQRHSCGTFTTISPLSFQPLLMSEDAFICFETWLSVLSADSSLSLLFTDREKKPWLRQQQLLCQGGSLAQTCCAEEPGNSSCPVWQESVLKCRGHGEKGLWDITKPSRVIVYHQSCW